MSIPKKYVDGHEMDQVKIYLTENLTALSLSTMWFSQLLIQRNDYRCNERTTYRRKMRFSIVLAQARSKLTFLAASPVPHNDRRMVRMLLGFPEGKKLKCMKIP